MGLKPSGRLICGAMTLIASLHTLLTSISLRIVHQRETSAHTKTCFLGSRPSTIASGREWSPGGHDHWFLRLVYLGIQKLLSVKDPIYIKW